MDSNDAWADFEVRSWLLFVPPLALNPSQNLRHTVNHNTVDKLKQILTGFNEQCKTSIPKSGKKQDLITRIIDQMATWRRENNVERWTTAQAILRSVRYSGMYVSCHASDIFCSSGFFFLLCMVFMIYSICQIFNEGARYVWPATRAIYASI